MFKWALPGGKWPESAELPVHDGKSFRVTRESAVGVAQTME